MNSEKTILKFILFAASAAGLSAQTTPTVTCAPNPNAVSPGGTLYVSCSVAPAGSFVWNWSASPSGSLPYKVISGPSPSTGSSTTYTLQVLATATSGIYGFSTTACYSTEISPYCVPGSTTIVVSQTLTSTCPTQPAQVGVPYGPVQLYGSGGTGSGYYWQAGTYPSGFTITASGLFAGTPTAAAYPSVLLSINIYDSGGDYVQVDCSLTVNLPSLSVSCPSTASVQVGNNLNSNNSCTATGGVAPLSWTLTSSGGGSSPGWINASQCYSGATCTLTGTAPSPPSSYPLRATVRDSSGQSAQWNITITVTAPAISLSCPSSPIQAAAGGPISGASCTVTGGTPPYTYTSSTLPSGVSGSPAGPTSSTTYTLSGNLPNPASPSYSIVVTVTDNNNSTAQGTININVTAALSVMCYPAPGTFQAGNTYVVTCSASGGTPPYQWQPTLPSTLSWLNASATTGASVKYSGQVPNTPGTFTATVQVSDSKGNTASAASFQIAIGATPLTLNCSNANPAMAVAPGNLYTNTCSVSGGTAPYTWSFSPPLPTWVNPSLAADTATETLSGTVPTSGASSYSGTLTLTDSSNPQGTKTQSITIAVSAPAQVPAITLNSTGTLPNQRNIVVGFANGAPATAAYSGVLTATFALDSSIKNITNPATYKPDGGFSSVGPDGTKFTANVNVSGNTGQTLPFSLGTVEGLWTFTLTSTSAGGTSTTLTVSPAAPTIDTVKIVTGSGSFTVQVAASSNTRGLTSANLTFTPTPGNYSLQGASPAPVQFNNTDQTLWFATPQSQNAAGTFQVSFPFTYSGDPNFSALSCVTVTLTNAVGPTQSNCGK